MQLIEYVICKINDFKISIGLYSLGHPLGPEGHSQALYEGHPKQVSDSGTMLMIDGPFKYFLELKTPKYLMSITRTESSGKISFLRVRDLHEGKCTRKHVTVVGKLSSFLFEPPIIVFLSFLLKCHVKQPGSHLILNSDDSQMRVNLEVQTELNSSFNKCQVYPDLATPRSPPLDLGRDLLFTMLRFVRKLLWSSILVTDVGDKICHGQIRSLQSPICQIFGRF